MQKGKEDYILGIVDQFSDQNALVKIFQAGSSHNSTGLDIYG